MNADYGNLVYLRKNVCIVRTQAGFRKAIKKFIGIMPEHHRSYPESYPSLVFLV